MLDTSKIPPLEFLRLLTPALIGVCLFMLSNVWTSLKEVKEDQSAIRERLVMIETTVQMQHRRK